MTLPGFMPSCVENQKCIKKINIYNLNEDKRVDDLLLHKSSTSVLGVVALFTKTVRLLIVNTFYYMRLFMFYDMNGKPYWIHYSADFSACIVTRSPINPLV